ELQQIWYVEPSEPATSTHIQRLIYLEPQLVILDAAAGAYDLQGLDDNRRADVEKFTRLYVKDFWRAEIATIVLDHVVKNADNRGNYAIGSERKRGGAFVHLGFTTISPISRGSDGLYKITTHKDRGGHLRRGRIADLELSSDPETHTINWTFKPYEPPVDSEGHWRPTHLMAVAYNYITEHQGCTKTQVYDAMTAKRRQDKVNALNYLLQDGFVGDRGDDGRSHLVPVSKYDITGLEPAFPLGSEENGIPA